MRFVLIFQLDDGAKRVKFFSSAIRVLARHSKRNRNKVLDGKNCSSWKWHKIAKMDNDLLEIVKLSSFFCYIALHQPLAWLVNWNYSTTTWHTIAKAREGARCDAIMLDVERRCLYCQLNVGAIALIWKENLMHHILYLRNIIWYYRHMSLSSCYIYWGEQQSSSKVEAWTFHTQNTLNRFFPPLFFIAPMHHDNRRYHVTFLQ